MLSESFGGFGLGGFGLGGFGLGRDNRLGDDRLGLRRDGCGSFGFSGGLVSQRGLLFIIAALQYIQELADCKHFVAAQHKRHEGILAVLFQQASAL